MNLFNLSRRSGLWAGGCGPVLRPKPGPDQTASSQSLQNPLDYLTCKPRLHRIRSVGFSRKPGPLLTFRCWWWCGVGCKVVDAKGTEEKMTQWAGPGCGLHPGPARPTPHTPQPGPFHTLLYS